METFNSAAWKNSLGFLPCRLHSYNKCTSERAGGALARLRVWAGHFKAFILTAQKKNAFVEVWICLFTGWRCESKNKNIKSFLDAKQAVIDSWSPALFALQGVNAAICGAVREDVKNKSSRWEITDSQSRNVDGKHADEESSLFVSEDVTSLGFCSTCLDRPPCFTSRCFSAGLKII